MFSFPLRRFSHDEEQMLSSFTFPSKSIGIHLLNVQRHEDEGGKKESKNNNPTFKSCPEIKSFLIFISAMCYSAVASLLLETLLGIC
jgi:hypothetical protein